MSDAELKHSYTLYVRALELDEGQPPSAAKLQYFNEYWREQCRGGRRR